jgi:hypothetical protein
MYKSVYAAIAAVGLFIVVPFAGCGDSGKQSASGTTSENSVAEQSGDEDGARALLQEFLAPGAQFEELTKKLRPADADYDAVFAEDVAAKARALYNDAWNKGGMVIAPKEGQTTLNLWGATTGDLQSWTGYASEFPGGYRDVASKFKDGLTFYRFKFVPPGEDLGMAFDGLVFVNGHWAIFPKPWMAVE